MTAFSASHRAHGRGAAQVAGGAVVASSAGLRESIVYVPTAMTESGRVIWRRCLGTPLTTYVPVSWNACRPLSAAKLAARAGPPTWVMAVPRTEEKILPPVR